MNTNTFNVLLATDGYKPSHGFQMPPGTEYETLYIEARGSKDPDKNFVMTVGLQAWVRKYLQIPFTRDDLEEAKEVFSGMGAPFDYEGFEYILNKHGGFFPVIVKALPEGTIAPLSVPLVQIKNTDPKVPWVGAYLETSLVRALWYGSTVASNSMVIRRMLKSYARKSASDENVDFKLVDFGARGVSSAESAGAGGFAHAATGSLVSDTVEAIAWDRRYYEGDIAVYTIPATQHSTMMAWPKEIQAFQNMLNKFAEPGANVAIVSDTYDLENAVKNFLGKDLKQQIIDSGATVICRPDSGDPLTIPIQVIEWLMDSYGYTTNEKGYKVLPDCIRVIQGDGITKDSIKGIIKNMDDAKLALDNITFGMGGGMLQILNRDDLQFAMKSNEIQINGEVRPVFKNPKTDHGKRSKAGAQAVVRDSRGNLQAVAESTLEASGATNEMKVVYDTGYVSPKWESTLAEIRERANS